MYTNFFNKTGKMAIGSRLRMLTDQITGDATRIYKLYGTDLKPKWFPVFFVLSNGEEKTITSIANEIGHSHPSVSNIIKEMTKEKLVEGLKDKLDGRRNVVRLTKKGKQTAKKLSDLYTDLNSTIEFILQETENNLWEAIGEWELLLSEKSLLKRVEEKKKMRESKDVKIVDYQDEYQEAFKALNKEWINTYFEIEEADLKILENPQQSIIEKGGYILVALYNNEPVGVCALMRMDNSDCSYELAKLAVSPKMQGKNIGFLLGQSVVDRAKELGASSIYLESNTILKPAINLYLKLGFVKVDGHATPYKRCNIHMELKLK